MSKMSEMAMTIEELRNVAIAVTDAANYLAHLFSDSDVEPMPREREQQSELALTLEQVRAVLADKSRAGYTAQIRNLLQKYGATRLSGIDPIDYKALLEEVEGLTDA